MTKIISASHAFTEREWFVVARTYHSDYRIAFDVFAFDTEKQACIELDKNLPSALGNDASVFHRDGFIDAVCRTAADLRTSVLVLAHLSDGMVFPIRFLFLDPDTVEVKLPEKEYA